MQFHVIELGIILCLGGLAYWAVNRWPKMADPVRQGLKIAVVVVTVLALLGAITGYHILPPITR